MILPSKEHLINLKEDKAGFLFALICGYSLRKRKGGIKGIEWQVIELIRAMPVMLRITYLKQMTLTALEDLSKWRTDNNVPFSLMVPEDIMDEWYKWIKTIGY